MKNCRSFFNRNYVMPPSYQFNQQKREQKVHIEGSRTTKVGYICFNRCQLSITTILNELRCEKTCFCHRRTTKRKSVFATDEQQRCRSASPYAQFDQQHHYFYHTLPVASICDYTGWFKSKLGQKSQSHKGAQLCNMKVQVDVNVSVD